MKALILTMTCGNGHNAMANNCKKGFEAKGVEAKVYNIYESNRFEQKLFDKSYVWSCEHIPHLYNKIWNSQRNRDPNKRYHGGVQSSIARITKPLLNIINEYQPDIILCTHNYASAIINNLIIKKSIAKCLTATILFDFVIHPYWENSIELDYILTPYQDVEEELIYKGFKPSQIKPLGLPTNPIFEEKLDKKECRKKLSLDLDKFTALAVSGGNGLGIINLVKSLSKSQRDFQLICICGNNAKMKAKVDKYCAKHNLTNIYTYGFVNNIQEFLYASDCVFCRGGSGTISESVHTDLPIIFREGIITNEIANARLIEKRGAAIILNNVEDAPKVLEYIIDNPAYAKKMIENSKYFIKNNVVSSIVDFLISKVK